MSTPPRLRATKIICTIGPATDTSDMLGSLIQAGANVFRLNMSHSKHDWVREVVFRIRRKAAELQANVAILFDLQGPSIRTGDLSEPYNLKAGDIMEIRLSTAEPELPFSTTVNYDGLLQDVQAGHTMVVDNGGILMRIEEVRPDRLICKVLTEGVFGSRRHINLPGVALRLPALTEKDLKDLKVAVECETDYVAMSFVRDAAHIAELREHIDNLGGAPRSSLKLKTSRPSAISMISFWRRTSLWWPAATWALKSALRNCPSSSAASSVTATGWAAAASSPRTCWNP